MPTLVPVDLSRRNGAGVGIKAFRAVQVLYYLGGRAVKQGTSISLPVTLILQPAPAHYLTTYLSYAKN